MDANTFKAVFDRVTFGEDDFHELMRWRILRILVVLPHYDAWILEHDAKLADQIVGEYHQLNLTTVPRLTTVADGEEALEMLTHRTFELIIIGMRVGEISPAELAERAKALHPEIAVLLLLSSRSDLAALGDDAPPSEKPAAIDAHFLWTGDSRLFLAMIKYMEDKKNVPHDARDGRVGVLLVVEDSIPFHSAYLPLLYGEMMTQTQRLIAEEMNESEKYWRMRTRPKILLARNWEEALDFGQTYSSALIGIVCDVSFRRGAVTDERAGFAFIEQLRSMGIDVPVIFQSSDEAMALEAERLGARFQSKRSADLHRGIRRFILEELGFGDFVFRDSHGDEIRRVSSLREFEIALQSLPAATIGYHAERNDFSRWMAAHGEYRVARRIRAVHASDFPDAEAHREFLFRAFREVREVRYRGRLVEFRFDDPGAPGAVARYGSGSLGGKGRGLAFFNALLNAADLSQSFAPFRVEIPRTLIITTGEFDRFIEEHGLPPEGVSSDDELYRAFLAAPVHAELADVLRAVIDREEVPLAVRSSALLEDSQSTPFAGIYSTYMIPSYGGPEKRFRLLHDAVRLVWACTFCEEAAKFRDSSGVGREEEKMAVVIQSVCGREHEGFWFPRLSGTAGSLNFYPVGPMERDDGTACIAVGLGRSVVDGDRGYLFCPRRPTVQWSSEEARWREGQTHLWALKNSEDPDATGAGGTPDLSAGESSTLERLSIRRAETMDVLRHMASTWDAVGERLVDGIDTPGPRVVDFRDILVYDWLPLAPLLDHLLRLSRSAMGIPVELEFALDWKGFRSDEAVFSLLQVRPLISKVGKSTVIPAMPEDAHLVLRSGRALGHGIIRGIQDVVWVDPDRYSPEETESLRDEVAAVMEKLAAEHRHAVLIGPGRWGSRDRFLGIPVSWSQVRMAKLIVEAARGPGDPEPSQGSHFFHNLVALGVGYAHVGTHAAGGFIDWDYLRRSGSGDWAVRHSRLESPVDIVMDGKNGRAWLVK